MRISTLASMLVSAGLLSACGGWWNDDEVAQKADDTTTAGTPATTPPATTPEVAKPAGLALSGVVAQGAAMAGATINVKCATGSGTATTNADGSYSLSIVGGALPCVLEAESADKSLKLHSAIAAEAGTTTVTANVTPLTTLLVAQVVGTDPATFFSDSTVATKLAAAVTTATVTAGQTAVIDTLKAAGIDTSAISNLVSQPLVAATGSTTGNAYDKVLDTVTDTLKISGTTLATLTATVAQTSPAAKPPTTGTSESEAPAGSTSGSTTGTTTTATSSPLPADLLLKPKAANCDSLRSTTYRMVVFAPQSVVNSPDTLAPTNTATIDAKALTITWKGQTTAEQWTTHPADKCRFTNANNDDIAISPAGVLVARQIRSESGTRRARIVVGFPEQTIALADLAGKWNGMTWSQRSSTRADWNREGGMSTIEIGSDGAVLSDACEADALSTPEANCTKVTTKLPKLSVNSVGGFNLTSTDPADPNTERLFAYKSGTGATMMLSIGKSGEPWFMTRVRSGTLPAVGAGSTTYGFNLDANMEGRDLVGVTSWTAVSVDTAASTFVRSSLNGGQDSNTAQNQTIEGNKSRTGYSHRLVTSGTAANGVAYTVREFYAMNLAGMGLSTVIVPRNNAEPSASNGLLSLSVTTTSSAPTGALRGASLLANFVTGTSWDDRVLAYVPTTTTLGTGTGLTGAWSLSATGSKASQTLFFLSGGEYVLVDPIGDKDCGKPGIEQGTYSFGGGTLTRLTTPVDTNGCGGLNDLPNPANNKPLKISFAADQRSATVTEDNGNVFTIYRLPR